MSEFVKKSALNNYKQVPGGQQDPKCSHVILTLEEYENLCQERDKAKQERQAAQMRAEDEVKRSMDWGRDRVKQAEDKAKAALDEVKQQLAIAQEDAEHQRELNENLLRICRERANSDRKLKPKKKHSGFIVMSSAEREYRYKAGKELKAAKLWETKLQSPYSVDFTDGQARQLIIEGLLQEDENGLCPMEKLGIENMYLDKYEELLQDSDLAAQAASQNIMTNVRLRADHRAGYWEVTFLHTEALGRIPQDMRR